MPNNNSWFQGEYILGRIIITIIGILLTIWIFFLCFVEYRLRCYNLYNNCAYKTAKIVPIPEATITFEHTNSYAKEIPLNENIIIL